MDQHSAAQLKQNDLRQLESYFSTTDVELRRQQLGHCEETFWFVIPEVIFVFHRINDLA
jgi:hypothetical protein